MHLPYCVVSMIVAPFVAFRARRFAYSNYPTVNKLLTHLRYREDSSNDPHTIC